MFRLYKIVGGVELSRNFSLFLVASETGGLWSEEMKLKVVLMAAAVFAVAQSIPRSFRKELPADELISFESYRDDVDGKDYRLPNNTKPIRYDISLSTDVHRGDTAFSGTVKIQIQAIENTNNITLHYRQITIENIVLYSNPASPVLIEDNVGSTSIDDVEFLVIQPRAALVQNQIYLVEIKYHGLLRDDNMGFYRSFYKNPQGQTVWLATTQFEQTDARHAFPCYDEPQIRAPFGIEIRHDASYHAISNAPVLGSPTPVAGTNYVITKFRDTLPVQTYLVAFIVSDFKNVANSDAIQQRVFAKPQSVDNGEADLALDTGKKVLDKFQEHLNVPYDLPKMDQVAVPDFDAGAMENWGLVTYREEYLLFNEAIATTRQRENILTVIAHEFAVKSKNFIFILWRSKNSKIWRNSLFALLSLKLKQGREKNRSFADSF